MPRHDYRCTECGKTLSDVYRTIEQGAQSSAPRCPSCFAPMEWIPQVGMIDAYEPFKEFDLKDGRDHLQHVDSLRKLRKVERESEAQYRDGVGQPLVWRHYAQDSSNKDQHTLMADPSAPLPKNRKLSVAKGDAIAQTSHVGTPISPLEP